MKFTGVTNTPSPMLSDCLQKRHRNAVEKVKISFEPAHDGIFDIGFSVESTGRKRGHSSLYGIVTALPIITGKDRVKGLLRVHCMEK